MKQLVFVGLLTLVGALGPLVYEPFCGVAVYYAFAVLRPQYIWEWSLPAGVPWSRFVALATIVAAFAKMLGVFQDGSGAARITKSGSPTNVLMALFCVWINVTYFMAQNREAAETTYTEYLKIFVMFAAASVIIGTVRQLWTLLILAAAALSYISYEVNSLYLFQRYLGIYTNGYGGLDNNGAGLMLAMGVPLCLMIWDGMRSRWRWAFLAMIPVVIHAVLMTFSRGAMVSLLAVCPLLALRCRRRAQLAPFVVLLVLAIPFLAGREIRERFLSVQEHEVDESANLRRRSWSAAWEMAKENPVFGVGVRNSNLLSFRYGADVEGRTIHSQYLQIAADNGFVGLGLYVGVIATTFLNAHRVRRAVAQRDDPEASQIRAVASGVECSLAIFCVGGAFLSLEVFELPYLLILLGAQSASMAEGVARREVDVEMNARD